MALDFQLMFRCDKKEADVFKIWCEKAGKDYPDFLREVISAAPEGRLHIKTDEEKKKILKELYK